MRQSLTIDRWHPAKLNELIGHHFHSIARRKRDDKMTVGVEAFSQGLVKAAGRRRVELVLTLGPRQRAGDPDAYWKSLLDALVHAGLLVDDNRQHVELSSVEYRRGQHKATEIILTDLDGGA